MRDSDRLAASPPYTLSLGCLFPSSFSLLACLLPSPSICASRDGNVGDDDDDRDKSDKHQRDSCDEHNNGNDDNDIHGR